MDKGGRIFEAKSWAEAESVASFKAIVEIDASSGGVTKPVARAKTKTQVLGRMIDIVKERTGDKKQEIRNCMPLYFTLRPWSKLSN